MNQKNCKFGTYYLELIKKSGLVVPVFGALAMFAILFYVRFVGMFDDLSAKSPIAYWLFIIGAVIGIGLIVAYIVMGIKSEKLGAHDTLLLTLDFLMIFLLLGMIIYNFVSLETVFYAIALIAVALLGYFRIRFAKVERTCCCCKHEAISANTTVSKYFSLVMEKYGFWKIFFCSFATFGAILVSKIWNFPELFLSEASYTVGLLIVSAIAFAMLVISMIYRISSCEVNGVDAFVVFALFTTVLSLFTLFTDYTITKLALLLVALIVVYTFVLILARNTYHGEEETDSAYFKTDANRTFVKGPKVYLRQFVKKFNPYVLGGIALMMFVVFNALAATDLFGWAADNGFMLYLVLGLLIFMLVGIIYLAKNLKKPTIGLYDAFIALFDVSLLLLAITIFANLGDAMTATLVIWIIQIAILIAFTITRLFMVKEEVEDNSHEEKTEE